MTLLLEIFLTRSTERCVRWNAQHLLVGHTVRLSLAARINRRRRPFILILGSARVQNGHRTGTQRELKNPTPTFTFSFILSSAWPLLHYPLSLFYQRTGSVCPFECAALTSTVVSCRENHCRHWFSVKPSSAKLFG